MGGVDSMIGFKKQAQREVHIEESSAVLTEKRIGTGGNRRQLPPTCCLGSK